VNLKQTFSKVREDVCLPQPELAFFSPGCQAFEYQYVDMLPQSGENSCFGAIFLSANFSSLSYCTFPDHFSACVVFQSEGNEKGFFFLSRIKAKHRRCQMINIGL